MRGVVVVAIVEVGPRGSTKENWFCVHLISVREIADLLIDN